MDTTALTLEDLTPKERLWIYVFRLLPEHMQELTIEAAEAIAEGREPPPIPSHLARPETEVLS